ncbi:MAG: hypothetical protein IKO36_08845 [Bacteroidaceae bacterium]|nr:hypothetical protein [Bacteroidaceae bacterium]
MHDNREKILLETIQELLGENKSVYAIFNQDDIEKCRIELIRQIDLINKTITTIGSNDDRTQRTIPKQDINTLKKRIKHAKNPMEKRLLQQQLNTAYKDKSMERKQNKRRGKR